jgi:hypothetical protein
MINDGKNNLMQGFTKNEWYHMNHFFRDTFIWASTYVLPSEWQSEWELNKASPQHSFNQAP